MRRVSRCPLGSTQTIGSRPRTQLLQPGLLERRADEPDVDLAGAELLDVQHRGAEAEDQLDVGVPGAVGGDDRAGDAAGQRPREAHAQPSALAGARGARDLSGAVGAGQQLARLAEQRASRRRQHGAATVALEQLDAELGLERPDLLADARLGEVQPVGGAAEVKLLRDRDERAQLPELHGQA